MKQITSFYKILLVVFLFLDKGAQSQQCTANFTFSFGSNGTVFFTSTSTTTVGAFTSYQWTFGNNTFSTIPAPNVNASTTYTSNGTYTVMLYAQGTCTSTSIQVINVSSVCNVSSNFSVNPGNGGFVSFTNLSTGTVAGSTYSWSYGDGSTGSTFAHVYTITSSYNPTLTVTNTVGCSSATTQPLFINVCAPGMTASVLSTTNTAGNVSFVNTSTGTGTNTAFNLYSTGPAPSTSTSLLYSGNTFSTTSHTFSANGTYSINLVVYNTFGPMCADTSQTNVISVTNYTPPCSGIVDFYSTSLGNGQVTYSNTSTGLPSGTTFTINYGDGNVTPIPSVLAPHTYSANGTYTAVLIANNNFTPVCSSTKTIIVSVTSICSTSFSATVGSSGTTTFVANTIPFSASTSYTWDFGNSTSSITINPFIITNYPVSGVYTVYLQSYNGSCTASYTGFVSVTSPTITPCNLVSSFLHTVGATGYVDLVSTSTGTSATTQYAWSFGDGYTTTGNPASHLYSSNSSYIVKLLITDGLCSDTSAQSINITGASCHAEANFALSPADTAQEWNATPAYPWNISGATWHWGDGTTSNLLYTSHIYSAPGNYTICLTVTVSCGDSATYCSAQSIFKPTGSDETSGFVKVNVIAPGSTVTGISQTEANPINFEIYPNPTNGEFNLKLDGIQSGKLKIAVYTILGVLSYVSENETSNGTLTKSINLENMPDGVYFIKVSSGNKTYTRKILLNK